MARIIGNLRPEDDYTHELGPEPNFNESMYFNFCDREQGLGGFLRLGNRANEKRAEMTVTVFLPDGRALFAFKRPSISSNAAMDAGGLRFEVLEPAERLRTVFDGDVLDLAEPRDMADPRRAFSQSPKRRLAVDLVHEAVGPMYGHAGDADEAGRSAEEQFARAHYEQHMHVTGSLRVDDAETWSVDGYGLRDHSWGPRSWQAIRGYEWLTMNFGAELGAMVSVIRRDGSEPRIGGVVVRGEELDPVTGASVEADYEDGSPYHRALRVRFETRSGAVHEVEGHVRGFIPLRNRREGRTTHIGEGMTEWRMDGRVGYGLSELLRTLD